MAVFRIVAPCTMVDIPAIMYDAATKKTDVFIPHAVTALMRDYPKLNLLHASSKQNIFSLLSLTKIL
jgi:hypothetical protein